MGKTTLGTVILGKKKKLIVSNDRKPIYSYICTHPDIQHNCFVAWSCDAPESKQKLKGHKISQLFDTHEEVK